MDMQNCTCQRDFYTRHVAQHVYYRSSIVSAGTFYGGLWLTLRVRYVTCTMQMTTVLTFLFTVCLKGDN